MSNQPETQLAVYGKHIWFQCASNGNGNVVEKSFHVDHIKSTEMWKEQGGHFWCLLTLTESRGERIAVKCTHLDLLNALAQAQKQ